MVRYGMVLACLGSCFSKNLTTNSKSAISSSAEGEVWFWAMWINRMSTLQAT